MKIDELSKHIQLQAMPTLFMKYEYRMYNSYETYKYLNVGYYDVERHKRE